MGDVLGAFFTVIIGLAILAGVLGGLVRPHPVPAGRVARAGAGARCSWCRRCSSCSPGCSCPAIRTLWVSFLDDTGKKWVGLDNYQEIFSGKGTRLIAVQQLHLGGRSARSWSSSSGSPSPGSPTA